METNMKQKQLLSVNNKVYIYSFDIVTTKEDVIESTYLNYTNIEIDDKFVTDNINVNEFEIEFKLDIEDETEDFRGMDDESFLEFEINGMAYQACPVLVLKKK